MHTKSNPLKTNWFSVTAENTAPIVQGNAATTTTQDLRTRLEARAFNLSQPPPQAEARYFLAGVPVFRAGNLSVIAAKPKAGKTAVVGALLSSTLLPAESNHVDCLGFTAIPNSKGQAVLHLDTEQSRWDHYALVKRALIRAGVKDAPRWLLSYGIPDFSAAERFESFITLANDAAQRFGGIHSIIVDGTADLLPDVNDAERANEVTACLLRIATTYEASVIVLIHLNPDGGKTRGHLGSELERKAETNVRIEKQNGISTIFAPDNRGAPISKAKGPRFAWCDASGMHKSVSPQDSRTAPTDSGDALSVLADKIFEGTAAIGTNDAQRKIQSIRGCSETTAKNLWRRLKSQRLVQLAADGKKYERQPPQS